MTILNDLTELGQAVWLDYIRRSFIRAGDLQALIDQGVRGVTSNPAIFEKAIAGSDDYDDDILRLVGESKTVNEIYEALALEDIRQAADLLRPLYDRTDCRDGYVSLEVSPTLAHDTSGTVADAKRLFAAADRPNLMIKIPATPAGIPAIESVIAAGINVNVTLIFSLMQYEAAAGAYINGLEKLLEAGGALGQTASVASFFISRVHRRGYRPGKNRPQRSSRHHCHRQRKAGVCSFQGDFCRRALGQVGTRRRPGPAAAVGQHRNQEPCVCRYPLCGQPRRAGHGQHAAAGYLAGLYGPWTSKLNHQ